MKFKDLTPQIAVHCKSLDEVEKFEQMCKEQGINYLPGMFDGSFRIHEDETCFRINSKKAPNGVSHQEINWYKEKGYEVIEFTDLEDKKMDKKIKFEDIIWEYEVVHCNTSAEVKAFEKMCKKHNWNIGNETVFTEGYGNYNNNVCFRHDEYKIPVYGSVLFYKGWGYNIIEFSDVIDTPKQYPTIVITTDGVTTTATMRQGHEVLHKATAICSENDEFDYKTGAELALGRVFVEEELNSTRMNGKYVRLTPGQDVTVGKIYEFVNGNCVKTDNSEVGIFCPSFNDKNWLKIIE